MLYVNLVKSADAFSWCRLMCTIQGSPSETRRGGGKEKAWPELGRTFQWRLDGLRAPAADFVRETAEVDHYAVQSGEKII